MKLSFFVAVLVASVSLTGCGPSQEEIERRAAERAKWNAAEEKARRWREEGAQILEQTDNAIREEADARRSRLEKASKSVRTTNRDGVRVDQYILKKGGVISCTTTISGNAPVMFNCDGDV